MSYIQYRLLCVTQATYRAIKVIHEPWKSPKDVLMRRPETYFAIVLKWLVSTNLPKTFNYIQYKVLFVTQVPYHAIRVINEPWKSTKDVLMRRPATYFATVLNWLASTNLPKTWNYIQYRVLFVIQVPYHAIRVINEPWKSTKDVLMRRPATHFVTVSNWLVSTILPKTLNYIQYRLLCVTQMTYCAIKVIAESWKKSQGRPYETSCNIFCNSFKLIGVYKSPKNIKLFNTGYYLSPRCHITQ